MAESRTEKLLRKRVVLDRTGVSNSTLYNLIKRGLIKPGVPIGARMKGWPESEIDAFVQSCIEARNRGTVHCELRKSENGNASQATKESARPASGDAAMFGSPSTALRQTANTSLCDR